MLVLTCKIGEQVVMPGIEAQVKVLAIKGKAVRLGVEAPAAIRVHRAEIAKQVHRDAQVSAVTTRGSNA